jgi:hypothetical protein
LRDDQSFCDPLSWPQLVSSPAPLLLVYSPRMRLAKYVVEVLANKTYERAAQNSDLASSPRVGIIAVVYIVKGMVHDTTSSCHWAR